MKGFYQVTQTRLMNLQVLSAFKLICYKQKNIYATFTVLYQTRQEQLKFCSGNVL